MAKTGKTATLKSSFCVPWMTANVLVSYAKVGSNKNAPSEKFDKTGKSVLTLEKIAGKVSFVSIGDGLFRHLLPVDGFQGVLCKFRASQIYFRLDGSSVDGKATITKVKVTSKSPFKTELKTEFNIKLGGLRARAFDVNDSEQLFRCCGRTRGFGSAAKSEAVPAARGRRRRHVRFAVSGIPAVRRLLLQDGWSTAAAAGCQRNERLRPRGGTWRKGP